MLWLLLAPWLLAGRTWYFVTESSPSIIVTQGLALVLLAILSLSHGYLLFMGKGARLCGSYRDYSESVTHSESPGRDLRLFDKSLVWDRMTRMLDFKLELLIPCWYSSCFKFVRCDCLVARCGCAVLRTQRLVRAALVAGNCRPPCFRPGHPP
jgi:hypothetical protein